MLTAEDLRPISIFASIPPDALEKVARGAADMRLLEKEYAYHEGDEAGLFVVIAGRLEVTKIIDGHERTLGERTPGKLLGEIPMTYGTRFPSAGRAMEPSRVMHLNARAYHELALAQPEFGAAVRALAQERIGGLQGIAAEPFKAQATAVGDPLDDASLELRRFLERNHITDDWIAPDATGLDPSGDDILVTLDGGETVRARTAIIATGVSWRRVAIDGFDKFAGKGVYYGAARSDARIAQGQDVHLIGAGNSAGQAAMFLSNHARKVTLVVRGAALEKSMSQYLIDQIAGKSNISVALRSEVKGVRGGTQMEEVDIHDAATGAIRTESSGGVFVFIGADAETGWLPGAIRRDPRGYVLTGIHLPKDAGWTEGRDPYLLETSVPGIFACGDVRLSPVKRVAAAVGEGSMAIAFIHQYLSTLTKRAGQA